MQRAGHHGMLQPMRHYFSPNSACSGITVLAPKSHSVAEGENKAGGGSPPSVPGLRKTLLRRRQPEELFFGRAARSPQDTWAGREDPLAGDAAVGGGCQPPAGSSAGLAFTRGYCRAVTCGGRGERREGEALNN